MQLSINTTHQRYTRCLKNFESKVATITIALVLSSAGFLTSGDVYAKGRTSQSASQLAANDKTQSGYHKKHKSRQHKNAASTSNAANDNNQLGGYSLQDGAMQGPYGDGEYAE